MRTLVTQISSKINEIGLGTLNDSRSNETITPLNRLVPYAAASEDFEVILKHEGLLPDKLPVEMNGFNSHLNMKKAVKIGGETGRTDTFYTEFTTKHPVLLSFPSEVLWLGVDKGVDRFKDSFDWVAKRRDLGIDPNSVNTYSDAFVSMINRSNESYRFWKEITDREQDSQMARVLLESTVNMAILTRSTFLAGLTPLITKHSTTVGVLSQRFNLAYGAMIADYEDSGEKCPRYLYTINLDSSAIPKDQYTDELKDIVSRSKASLETGQFDGIFISVRGLKSLSSSEGRVNTLRKFCRSLCEVAQEERLPIWFSRMGLISLAMFELGGSYGSFQLNNHIEDIYHAGFKPKGPVDPKIKFGTVLDPDTNRILTVRQVTGQPHGLTHLDGVPNRPSELDVSSDVKYRKNFARPRNIAAMVHLNEKWLIDVQNGETSPGCEYLSRFSEPNFYCNWGQV